jgi:hypothetical protein
VDRLTPGSCTVRQDGLYTSAGTADEYVIEFCGAVGDAPSIDARESKPETGAYRRWLDPACAITGGPSQKMSGDDTIKHRRSVGDSHKSSSGGHGPARRFH